MIWTGLKATLGYYLGTFVWFLIIVVAFVAVICLIAFCQALKMKWKGRKAR